MGTVARSPGSVTKERRKKERKERKLFEKQIEGELSSIWLASQKAAMAGAEAEARKAWKSILIYLVGCRKGYLENSIVL